MAVDFLVSCGLRKVNNFQNFFLIFWSFFYSLKTNSYEFYIFREKVSGSFFPVNGETNAVNGETDSLSGFEVRIFSLFRRPGRLRRQGGGQDASGSLLTGRRTFERVFYPL